MKRANEILDRESAREADLLARERRRAAERNDLDLLLQTKPGRRVLSRILSKTGVFRLSYTRNADTYFFEGQRSIGLWLVREILEAGVPQEVLVELLGGTAVKEQETEDGRRA